MACHRATALAFQFPITACLHWLRGILLRLQAQTLRSELVLSAHAGPVYGLAFAHEYAELFATSALGEIRVWHTATGRELLRISVPNLHCKCLAFMPVCLFALLPASPAQHVSPLPQALQNFASLPIDLRA